MFSFLGLSLSRRLAQTVIDSSISFDNPSRCLGLTCPLLLLHGQRDYEVPSHMSEEIFFTVVSDQIKKEEIQSDATLWSSTHKKYGNTVARLLIHSATHSDLYRSEEIYRAVERIIVKKEQKVMHTHS